MTFGSTDAHGYELGAENFLMAREGLIPDRPRGQGMNLVEEDYFIATQGLAPDRPGLAGLGCGGDGSCSCCAKKKSSGIADILATAVDRVSGLSDYVPGPARGMGSCVPGMAGLGWIAHHKDAENVWVDEQGFRFDGSRAATTALQDAAAVTGVIVDAGSAVLRDPTLGPYANRGIAKLIPGGVVQVPVPVQPAQGPSLGTVALWGLGLLGAAGAGKLAYDRFVK